MEYLIIKAIVANTLKEIRESRIILKDLINIDSKNDSLIILLNKTEHLSEKVKTSLDKLDMNIEQYREITDKQEIMEEIDFDINFIRNFNDIKSSLDTISYKYIEYV